MGLSSSCKRQPLKENIISSFTFPNYDLAEGPRDPSSLSRRHGFSPAIVVKPDISDLIAKLPRAGKRKRSGRVRLIR